MYRMGFHRFIGECLKKTSKETFVYMQINKCADNFDRRSKSSIVSVKTSDPWSKPSTVSVETSDQGLKASTVSIETSDLRLELSSASVETFAPRPKPSTDS
jgi:hypothetical protein